MASLYSELLGLDPTRKKLTKKFYLDMLKARGISTRGLTPEVVLDKSPAVIADCDRLEHIGNAVYHRVAAKVSASHPTSIRVLLMLGAQARTPAASIVFGLAVRQLAEKPTAKMREAVANSFEDIALDVVGIDLLAEAYGELEDYVGLVELFLACRKLSVTSVACASMEILSTLVDHDSDEAVRLFEMMSRIAEAIPDSGLQTERLLACIAQRYYQFGADAEFQGLLTRFMAIDDALDSEDHQASLDDYEDRIPGLAVAMHLKKAPQKQAHASRTKQDPSSRAAQDPSLPNGNPMKDFHRLIARQKFESIEEMQAYMDTLTGKPIPEIPLSELTPDEFAQDLVEESAVLEDHERRTVLMGIAKDYPDSMWPWLGLIEVSTSPHELLSYAEGGLLRGLHFEDPDYLRENTGHFWGIHATRPYLRLLMYKATALANTGKTEDSIALHERILVLNPMDNLGARLFLLPLLLRRGLKHHLARATTLVEQFADAGTVPMNDWMVLLLNIITKQSDKIIASSFHQGMLGNKHIGYYIANINPLKLKPPISDPTPDEKRSLENFIRVGMDTWESYPDAVRKLKQLVGRT